MIYTNFKLPGKESDLVFMDNFLPNKNYCRRLIGDRKKISALLISNPSTKTLFFLFALRIFGLVPYKVFVFDLILKYPQTAFERLVAKAKGVVINTIDFIFVIHKDTNGYENFYGLNAQRFIYIPFKANNFDFCHQLDAKEGDYIVALGASQRDYRTLVEAAKLIEEKVVIVCSDENAKNNNADLGDGYYPPNLTRIKDFVDSKRWYQYLAESKFVVVPIRSAAIQPAGISVYLEAMMVKKAVIVSEGASTNLILQNGLNAITVPAGDAAKLAFAINKLNNDSQLRSSIAQAGYDYALSLGNDVDLRARIYNEVKSRL
jgi:glycosyltransferase involved in cell wall biosynthesis